MALCEAAAVVNRECGNEPIALVTVSIDGDLIPLDMMASAVAGINIIHLSPEANSSEVHSVGWRLFQSGPMLRSFTQQLGLRPGESDHLQLAGAPLAADACAGRQLDRSANVVSAVSRASLCCVIGVTRGARCNECLPCVRATQPSSSR